jgi:polyhydroxyalkanoate depolymerase
MLYQAFQAHEDVMGPIRALAGLMHARLEEPGGGLWRDMALTRGASASLALTALMRMTSERPSFGIPKVVIGNREIEVVEEPALVTPFGTLLHFRKDISGDQPRVLVVAPLSGHFATLLRSTVATLLPEHDVYITDWHNARDVPKKAGRFGFEDYTDHLIRFLEGIGPGAHVVAVCQPCVTTLAAVARMAEDDNPAQPAQLVRGECHCRGARPLQGRRPQGLSGLRAAQRLHVDEYEAPCRRASHHASRSARAGL